ncbi:hypothetical protein NDU88_004744 [Pleurodeles waltl]|uniref:Uncharacterized protein n=1 Tax=Pleurodeles waltl TaxID=8319 RepID=A0AAV7WZ75_PLEWA|nr:hypothetical protein NDU88_004744 [Pleurodeles waltl]
MWPPTPALSYLISALQHPGSAAGAIDGEVPRGRISGIVGPKAPRVPERECWWPGRRGRATLVLCSATRPRGRAAALPLKEGVCIGASWTCRGLLREGRRWLVALLFLVVHFGGHARCLESGPPHCGLLERHLRLVTCGCACGGCS